MRRAEPIALAGLSLLLAAGCSKAPAPRLREAGPLEFGTVHLGSVKDLSVTFENRGDRAVQASAELGGENPEAFSIASPSFAIPAHGTAVLSIRFRPTHATALEARLHCTLPGADAIDLALRGAGSGPQIAIAPRSIAFGTAGLGAEAHATLSIGNDGNEPLRLGAFRDGAWVPLGPQCDSIVPGELGVAWPPAGFDEARGIAPGESIEVALTFKAAWTGERAAVVTLFSDDALAPVVRVEATASVPACQLELTPAALFFDTAAASEPATATLTLRARPDGGGCLVHALSLAPTSDAAFTLLGEPVSERALQPGESLGVQVRISIPPPRDEAVRLGYLRASVAGVPTEAQKVPLVAGPGPDCFILSPRSADFGTRDLCSAEVRPFRLVNGCAEPVVLDAIDAQPQDWQLTDPPSLPRRFQPGEALELNAAFVPFEEGALSGTLAARLQGRDAPVTAAVRGSGETVWTTDTFVVPERTRVDILFVIDDSASMAGRAALVEQYLDQYFVDLSADALDFHVGVTTGTIDDDDTALAGRLLPMAGSGARYLTADTPDARRLFADAVALAFANAGSGPRRLVRAARLALSQPLIGAENAGFLRPEAMLAVVPISDRDDQDTTSIADLTDFFVGLKGNARRAQVGFWSVATPQGGVAEVCSYTGGPALRLNAMAAQLPGREVPLCGAQWNRLLESIGHPDSAPRPFQLACRPRLTGSEPIRLTVDGQPFPAIDDAGQTRWVYVEASGRIAFTPAALPAAGRTVTVQYVCDCSPQPRP